MQASVTQEVVWALDARLDAPVRRALEDLARDWRHVFSAAPIVEEVRPGAEPILAVGPGPVEELTGHRGVFAPEEHEVVLRSGRGLAEGRRVLCVDGGGPRGLIYAIYAVSERVLGIDPFWFWTDQELAPRTEIKLEHGFAFRRTAPRFRWRGWFVDDKELLTAWAPSRQSAHGVSLDAWDAVFETLLRVGGNVVVPGAYVFPDEPQLALASARGLAIGQHRDAPLGLSKERWPSQFPISWQRNRGLLTDAWRESIAAFGDQEVVWTVGLCGTPGQPFQVDGDLDHAGRADVFTTVLAKQVDLVRQTRPGDDIVFDLRMDGVELAEAPHVALPQGVIPIWADDGHGRLRDTSLAPGQGVDYHVALTDEVASQLTEMVHPALIQAELGRAAAAGSTEYLMLDVSDVRNHALTSQFAMRLAWDSEVDVEGLWLAWAARYAGDHAVPFKALWQRYFETLWTFRDGRPERPRDMGYHRMARSILRAAAETSLDGDFPVFRPSLHYAVAHPSSGHRTWRSFIERTARGAEAVQPTLDALLADADAFLGRIAPHRRGFVHDHLLTHVALHAEGNRMLGAVARAVLHGESPSARAELVAAREHALDGLRVLRRGERGRWQDWYRGEQYVRAGDTLAMIDVHLDRLLHGRQPHLRDARLGAP